MLSRVFLSLLLLIQLWINTPVAAMTDPDTGIIFAPKTASNDLELCGVGTRRKGPIKVYSVGMYCTAALKEKLAAMSRSADKGKPALAFLRDGVKQESATFLLKMSFKVGAEKMASAIAESVAPRHAGNPADVEQLKGLVFNGISQAGGVAAKGTTFEFDCSPAGVEVAVDGKPQGKVPSNHSGTAGHA